MLSLALDYFAWLDGVLENDGPKAREKPMSESTKKSIESAIDSIRNIRIDDETVRLRQRAISSLSELYDDIVAREAREAAEASRPHVEVGVLSGTWTIPERMRGRRVRVTISDPLAPTERCYVFETLGVQGDPIGLPQWVMGREVAVSITLL